MAGLPLSGQLKIHILRFNVVLEGAGGLWGSELPKSPQGEKGDPIHLIPGAVTGEISVGATSGLVAEVAVTVERAPKLVYIVVVRHVKYVRYCVD